VAKVEARVREKVNGKVATGQCDGWTNIAKTAVVTSMMTVEHEVSQSYQTEMTHDSRMVVKAYLVRMHNMAGLPKTGDKLLELVRGDIQYMRDSFGVRTIAWCTDDGPDGKKMHRLLKIWLAWMIVLVCWAHQINLVVGDFLKLKLCFLDAVGLGLDVVKWFNNHSAALDLLRKEQVFTYEGKYFALLLPIVTRWTAHYLSVTRLLKVKDALKSCVSRKEDALVVCAGSKQEAKQKA
jgi:hypothetical protein